MNVVMREKEQPMFGGKSSECDPPYIACAAENIRAKNVLFRTKPLWNRQDAEYANKSRKGARETPRGSNDVSFIDWMQGGNAHNLGESASPEKGRPGKTKI